MTWGSGDRQNGLAIGQGATGAINDHIEVLAAELLQIIGITPITDHVVHPRWGWLTTPGEQGERVALLLQGGHQRLPHKRVPPITRIFIRASELAPLKRGSGTLDCRMVT